MILECFNESCVLKQRSLHSEAALSGLWKMSNYINQNVYLPKMEPFKWGCREFGMYWVIGVCREFIELGEGSMGKKEGTPYGIILTNWSCMLSPITLCGKHIGGGEVVKLCYLSWSDGVSCKNFVPYVWELVFS